MKVYDWLLFLLSAIVNWILIFANLNLNDFQTISFIFHLLLFFLLCWYNQLLFSSFKKVAKGIYHKKILIWMLLCLLIYFFISKESISSIFSLNFFEKESFNYKIIKPFNYLAKDFFTLIGAVWRRLPSFNFPPLVIASELLTTNQFNPTILIENERMLSFFDSSSNLLQLEMHKNNTFPPKNAYILELNNGNFFMSWLAYPNRIVGQFFNKDGTQINSFFEIFYMSIAALTLQDIALLSNGNIIVLIKKDDSLIFRIYDIFGKILISPSDFLIKSAYESADKAYVVPLLTDKFLIIWMERSIALNALILNNDGTKFKDSFNIQSKLNNIADFGRFGAGAINNLQFIVVYTKNNDLFYFYLLYAQIFENDGTKYGNEFKVSENCGNNQQYPAISMLDNKRFIITWIESGCRYGQIFEANGSKLGSSFLISIFNYSTYSSNILETPLGLSNLGNGYFASFDNINVQFFSYSGESIGKSVLIQKENRDATIYPSHTKTLMMLTSEKKLLTSYIENFSVMMALITIKPSIYYKPFEIQKFEFIVNKYVINNQSNPRSCVLSNGNIAIVWQSDGQDSSLYGIFARILDGKGDEVVQEFQVNTFVTDSQVKPAIAADSENGFLVIWLSKIQNNGKIGIYGQFFLNNGTFIGSEFRINKETYQEIYSNEIIQTSKGNWIISFTSSLNDVNKTLIRIFDKNRVALTEDILISEGFSGIYENSLFSLSNGKFKLFYFDQNENFCVQNFQENGLKIANYTVLIANVGNYTTPKAGKLLDDYFIVVWLSSSFSLLTQRFFANDSRVGSETYINKYSTVVSNQFHFIGLNNGKYIIAWIDMGTGATGKLLADIYAQLFFSNGGKIGSPFKINLNGKFCRFSNGALPQNVWLISPSNDYILFVWQSYEMDSSFYGISASSGKILSTISLYPNEIISIKIAKLLQPFTFAIPSSTFVETNSNSLKYEYQYNNQGDQIPWLNLDELTGFFSGTPPSYSANNYTIELFASNSAGIFASITFILQVINMPPIVIGSIPNIACEIFQTFRYTIVKTEIFKDPEDQAITLNTLDLPKWLSFNPETYSFGGTPAESDQGAYVITVVASDGYGGFTPATFTITVKNRPPTTIGTIPNKDVIGGHYFSFIILIKEVFYDPDNDVLKTSVSLSNGLNLPFWLSFESIETKFSGIPPSNDQKIYSIIVTASDGNGGITTSLFNISTSPNHVPILNKIISNKTDLVLNVPFTHSFPAETFSDADNDALTYTALQLDKSPLPAWLSFSSDVRTFQGTAVMGSKKVYFIVVTANDGAGGEAFCQFILSRPNSPPRVGMFPDKIIDGVGQSFSFSFANTMFVDDDGDTLILTASLFDGQQLPSWLGFDPNSRTFFGSPKSGLQGSYNITVSADDLAGGIVKGFFKLTLKNSLPVAQQLPSSQINIKKYFSYQFSNTSFQDPDGDPLQYYATWNETKIPNWMKFFSDNRTIVGIPISGSQGMLLIKITADDGFNGSASSLILFTIPNSLPFVKNKILDQICSFIGEDYLFKIPEETFYDPDEDVLSYEVALENNINLPNWLSFDKKAKIFTGKPTFGSQGSYMVRVSVSDSYGGFTYLTFKLIVPNRKPIINSVLLNQKTSFIGEQFLFTLNPKSFIDLDGDSLNYIIFFDGNMIPSWLGFNYNSLVFSGIPPTGSQGDHSIKVIVKDEFGGSENQTFVLTIPNREIQVNPISPKIAFIGISFYFIVNNIFNDFDGDTLIYTAQMENGAVLPSWLEFRNGVFAGIPMFPEELSIQITASKINGISASSSFKLTIKKFEISITAPQVSDTQKVNNLNITVLNEFNFIFPDDVFINPSGKQLSYKASQITQFSIEEDLPFWLNFTNRTFSGVPPKGSHVDKLIIKLTCTNIYQESASLTFKIFFQNRPPQLTNEIILKSALINSILIISLPFEDEDGDLLTFTLQDKISFLELNSETRRITVLPKIGDEGSHLINITANDGFGGFCRTEFRILVEFSDYDKWMRVISFLLPILSSLGTIFAIYTKRGLLWNLAFFLVRPRIVKWNIKNEKFKILVKDMPGWINREEFRQDAPSETTKLFLRSILLKLRQIFNFLTCRPCQKIGTHDENIRMGRLKFNIKFVQTIFIPKSDSFFLNKINSIEMMDYVIRSNYDLISAKIDKDDFSLQLKRNSKQYLHTLLKNGDQIKFLIINHDKRVLEKIVCELNPHDSERKRFEENDDKDLIFSLDVKERWEEGEEKNSIIMEEKSDMTINTKDISAVSEINRKRRKKLKRILNEESN